MTCKVNKSVYIHAFFGDFVIFHTIDIIDANQKQRHGKKRNGSDSSAASAATFKAIRYLNVQI